MQHTPARLAAALMGLTLALPMAWAQDNTKSLGGGAGTGKIMTLDELRVCLKRKDDLAAQVAKFEADRIQLDKDKAAILAENQELKGEKGDVQAAQGKVREINERQRAVADNVADWNARWMAFEKEGKTDPFADRQRRKLLQEKRDLEAENAALEAERAALSGGEASAATAAKGYNERAEAQQRRTVEWNARNLRIAETSRKLADEREFWAAECGSRRYLEQDEAAIRQGK